MDLAAKQHNSGSPENQTSTRVSAMKKITYTNMVGKDGQKMQGCYMLQTDCAYIKQYPAHKGDQPSRDCVAATLTVEHTKDILLHSWFIPKISCKQLTSSTFPASRQTQQEILLFQLLIYFSLGTRKYQFAVSKVRFILL